MRLIHHLKYVTKQPQIIPALIKNYSLMIILKKRLLRSIDFHITFNCQLHCSHCYSWTMFDPDKKRLSTEEFKNAIDSCLKLGAITINFVGGEPLIEKDIYELIKHTRNRKRTSILTTNGLLLTADVAKRLKDSGLHMVIISIDSTEPEEHDKFRNHQGAFQLSMKGIHNAKNVGLEIMVNTLITKEKLKNGTIDKVVNLFKQKGIIINFILPSPAGKWKDRKIEIFDEEQKTLDKYLSLPYVRWDGASNYFKAGCSAGSEKISITPYGDVIPCAAIQTSFGNILDEPLEKIWKRMMRISEFSQVQKKCLASQDTSFIENYIKKINNEDKLPTKANKIFNYKD